MTLLTECADNRPRCVACGSFEVLLDAWASWNCEKMHWELDQVFDDAYCNQCEEQTTLTWEEFEGE